MGVAVHDVVITLQQEVSEVVLSAQCSARYKSGLSHAKHSPRSCMPRTIKPSRRYKLHLLSSLTKEAALPINQHAYGG